MNESLLSRELYFSMYLQAEQRHRGVHDLGQAQSNHQHDDKLAVDVREDDP